MFLDLRELRGAPKFPVEDLLPPRLFLIAVEKLSNMLRNKAIRKMFLSRHDPLDRPSSILPPGVSQPPVVIQNRFPLPGLLIGRNVLRNLCYILTVAWRRGRSFDNPLPPSQFLVGGTLACGIGTSEQRF